MRGLCDQSSPQMGSLSSKLGRYDHAARQEGEKKEGSVVFVFVFVLMGWSLLPNALRPFKIYCAPPKLRITMT